MNRAALDDYVVGLQMHNLAAVEAIPSPASIRNGRVYQHVYGTGGDGYVDQNLQNEKGDAREIRVLFAL